MARCFFVIGTFLVLLLGSFCLWNCFHRPEPHSDHKWHGCRDQDGKKTDLFILYKLPHDKNSPYNLIQQGLGYMYLIPDNPDSFKQSGGVSSVLSYVDSTSGWLLSNISIADPKSMPGHTLDKLYNSKEFMENNALFIMYNDEFPNGTTSTSYGHTKGVLVMTEFGGFWLVHSTPKYPPPPSETGYLSKDKYNDGKYNYPSTGTRYGQSFMCISLPPEQADNIGWQLLQNHPHIYASHIGKSIEGKFSVLEKVLAGQKPISGSWHRVTQIATQQGTTLTSFAKYTKFGKDLYSELVSPSLKTGLLVESWRNGPNPLPSNCKNSTYKVENVEDLSVRVSTSSFSSHQDHSKWAVSSNSNKPYVCIGDINRMQSQFHRAGGTVCVWSPSIWNRFYKLVTRIESCPRDNNQMKDGERSWLSALHGNNNIIANNAWQMNI